MKTSFSMIIETASSRVAEYSFPAAVETKPNPERLRVSKNDGSSGRRLYLYLDAKIAKANLK